MRNKGLRIIKRGISKISALQHRFHQLYKSATSSQSSPSTASRSGCPTCSLATCALNARSSKNKLSSEPQKLNAEGAPQCAPQFQARLAQKESDAPTPAPTGVMHTTVYDASQVAQPSPALTIAVKLNTGQPCSEVIRCEAPAQKPTARQHDDLIIWGNVRQIKDTKLLALAARALKDQDLYHPSDGKLQIADRFEGSYNSVTVIQCATGTKYCLRIPAAGRPGRWTKEDAELMEADAMTMRYIRRKTGLLMPDVISFDSTCKNKLGHPYLLTTFIEGVPLYKLWDDDSRTDLEGFRQRTLQSIAAEISKLHSLTWDRDMGTLDFEDEENPEPWVSIEVDEGFPWEENFGVDRKLKEIQKPELSIIEYRQTMREVYMKHVPAWHATSASAKWRKGEKLLLNLLIHCLPDAEKYDILAEHPEIGSVPWLQLSQSMKYLQHTTMTIAPPDFNMQNIMVDNDGQVTGFLDWDGVQVVPCYRGWARYPKFLYRDWSLYFDNDSDLYWDGKEMEKYRQDYAQYMADVMDGQGDCQFTSKSHLYEVLHEALNLRLRRQDFVDKILAIIYPRADPVLFLERLHNTECKDQQGLKPQEMRVLWDRLQQLFQPVVGPDKRFSF